jgi:hypothetical protein
MPTEITQEELSSCFHLPSEAACRKLGIGQTLLRRQCRKFGIKRWPFRKMKSLDRLITNAKAVSAEISAAPQVVNALAPGGVVSI